VKSGRFLQRKLSSLCGDTADVVVVIEEESEQKADWKGNKYPFDWDIPEVNKPIGSRCRMKGF